MGKKIPPKITTALNAKNEWVYIDDVPQNGNQCDCFCPYCHAPLQAKKQDAGTGSCTELGCGTSHAAEPNAYNSTEIENVIRIYGRKEY